MGSDAHSPLVVSVADEHFHPYLHWPEALIHQTADSLDRMLGLKAFSRRAPQVLLRRLTWAAGPGLMRCRRDGPPGSGESLDTHGRSRY